MLKKLLKSKSANRELITVFVSVWLAHVAPASGIRNNKKFSGNYSGSAIV